ncbi:hypothetical protein FACS1894172_20500 [Spirochaetia bacterium]|nr:hypothetical protein FACS1894172_20500 [Spirochaetia bacterium]
MSGANKIDMQKIPGINDMHGVKGAFDLAVLEKDTSPLAQREKTHNKIVASLEEAIRLTGLKDGMTISFHHHFRGGDYIVNMVVDKLAEMGFKNLVLAASSLTDCHAPLIKHIENGVIRHIETSGLRGKLADAISHGLMDVPVVFRSHGGRRLMNGARRCFGSLIFRNDKEVQDVTLLCGGFNKIQMSLGKWVAVNHDGPTIFCAGGKRGTFQTCDKIRDAVFFIFHQQGFCGLCDGVKTKAGKKRFVCRFGKQEEVMLPVPPRLVHQFR